MVPVLQGELEFSFTLILNSTMHIILILCLLLSRQDCIGASDGTHVTARVPRSQSAAYRGRKHYIGQNILAAVDFDLKFTYVLAGWEGSAHDASILNDSLNRPDGIHLPEGKFYEMQVTLVGQESCPPSGKPGII
jgi:hypothetical protein